MKRIIKRIRQTVVTILLAPFCIALGVLVFGVLGIMTAPLSVRGHFEHRKWVREMRRSGRTLKLADVPERGGTGTLIVDQPGWGGKAMYCWWTPDDIASLSPVRIVPLAERIESLKFEIQDDDLPFDRWVYNEYLSRDTGTAFLVATRRGDVVASRLQADMGELRTVETWSAPVGEFGAHEPDNE